MKILIALINPYNKKIFLFKYFLFCNNNSVFGVFVFLGPQLPGPLKFLSVVFDFLIYLLVL